MLPVLPAWPSYFLLSPAYIHKPTFTCRIKSSLSGSNCELLSCSGIIERAGGSMEEEMEQLRRAQSLAAGEFALSDAFYFYKKGLESIADDQVTQRFSSEELASWNLLTRTNQNFRYISLRLTIIWVVGVFVRYGVLFPLRSVRVRAASHQIGSFNIAAFTFFFWGSHLLLVLTLWTISQVMNFMWICLCLFIHLGTTLKGDLAFWLIVQSI